MIDNMLNKQQGCDVLIKTDRNPKIIPLTRIHPHYNNSHALKPYHLEYLKGCHGKK
jgi:hypothetical protein